MADRSHPPPEMTLGIPLYCAIARARHGGA